METQYLAMLNNVYEDGSVGEIIAAELVKNPEEGELWFNDNKPEDGTHVDYTLFPLISIRNNMPTP